MTDAEALFEQYQKARLYHMPSREYWRGRVKDALDFAQTFLPCAVCKVGKAARFLDDVPIRWPGRKPKPPVDTPVPCPFPPGKRNSFTAETRVLMANGKWKLISAIRIGEYVTATDPHTGQSTYERVTATIKSIGTKRLVQITTQANGETSTITATDEHPFWNRRTGTWTNAIDLRPGDRLGLDGSTTVTGRTVERTVSSAFNLTVTGLHTYNVAGPGGASIVVHNADENVSWEWKTRPKPGADGGISRIGIERIGKDAISQVHRVTVDGQVFHEHQRHIGKHGATRAFPDE